jgi:chaperonin cofactor prefoldin
MSKEDIAELKGHVHVLEIEVKELKKKVKMLEDRTSGLQRIGL